MYRCVLFILLFYVFTSGRAQEVHKKATENSRSPFKTYSGVIRNPAGQGITSATIILFADGKRIAGVSSTVGGSFQLVYNIENPRIDTLQVSALGYKTLKIPVSAADAVLTNKSFGTLQLEPESKALNEVMVTGSQQLVELNGSNIVFNASKSIIAQGSNALELLSRAPGVTVGSDNSISLNGKSGPGILIDGKLTYLSGKEIAELLKSMSSSSVKSIEIINSPSAKYDASGTAGIINIVTQKSDIQGFNLALTSGLSYGVYLRNNQDLSFSYRKNRINVFGNYSHFLGNYSYLYGADRIQEGNFYNSFTDDIDKRKKIGSRVGADYSINKNQTVGVLLNGNFLFGGGITDTKTDIGIVNTANVDQVLTAINDYYYQQTQRYNVNLNYKYEDTLGRSFSIDADYGDFAKGSGNLQSNKYVTASNTVISDNLYRSLNEIDIALRAIKIDYSVNIWKGKFETGIRYSSVKSDNSARFLEVQQNGEFLDPSRSNQFEYTEEVKSGYVNYIKSAGKWRFEGGLRLENASSTGKLNYITPLTGNQQGTDRNYSNLFPSVSIAFKPSPSNNFSLSYSKRIDRPAYQNLNPFIYLLDELSYWQGNPFLQPQISDRTMLQYAFKSATIVGLSYTYVDNFSVEVTDTVDKTKIVMVPRNVGVQRHFAFTVNQTLSPLKWWDISFNGTLYRLKNDIDFGQGRNLGLSQTAARLNLQQSFRLPHGFKAEVVGVYNSKRLVGANQLMNATSQVDLGIQRNLLKDKATLRLAVSDIYKGSKASSIQNAPGLYIHNYSYFETRQVKINFSYRFASGNSKGPRSRSSALESENGRIK